MKLGVFIGLACLDMVYYQDCIPLENKKSRTNNYNVFIGGPATNAAITYAILGGRSVIISYIGDSDIGKIIKKQLFEDYGVEVIDCASGFTILPSIASIAVNVTTATRTIWSGQQLINNIDERYLNDVIKKADFCLSDCNLSELAIKTLRYAKQESKPIVLDAGSWKDNFELFLSLADDVIASADCRPSAYNNDFIFAANQCGVKNIAVTNGEDFIKWKSESDDGLIKPPLVEAKDTLGAGDVFHGAYCYFRFEKNLSFPESLVKASEVSALSVQYIGPREGVRQFKTLGDLSIKNF